MASVQKKTIGAGKADKFSGQANQVTKAAGNGGLSPGARNADDRYAPCFAFREEVIDNGPAHRTRLTDCGFQVHQQTGAGVDLDDRAALIRQRTADVLGDQIDARDVQADDPRRERDVVRDVRMDPVGDVERDVAVAFLIDMSASTDEEINKREKKYDEDDYDDDPRKYLSWWVSKRRQELTAPPKRIIDLEKESAVLLMTALETIGDQYGIYGFSGYGRDNVEFFVIKDFDESLDQPIKNRLDKITPIRSTRMGPAIRHATHKLKLTDAKVKILFLLSDGRPQDHGYGRDRTEKEYAIHDTKQALNEAKREGITPFALTVDRAGHDYLKTMCEDMGYEVVADIEALPSRLPQLYRRLTE